MRRLVVLALVLGLAMSPRTLMGQGEGRGGVRTGVLVGTAASSFAMTGLCAGGILVGDGIVYVDDRNASVLCPVWGALYGFIPALATGYGLSYPDRTTSRGRLRTVALGAAGGVLTALAMGGGGGALVYATGWGTGVGLATAFFGPSVQAFLFPSPAAPEARNTFPLGLGLALRFPLP